MPNAAAQSATNRTGVDAWFTPGRFAALFGVFLFITFFAVFTGRETFFYRDYGVFTYPIAQHYREAFWHGELPLWNHLNCTGIPLLAQWNTAMLYPPSLFYLVFPLPWSLGVFSLCHLWLAAMGMYFLARRWTGSQLAAAVAGLAFGFNGLSWYMVMWLSNLGAYAWMPWVVLAVESAWREGGGRRIVLASLAGAMQMLAGAPEIILLTWGVLGCLWLMEMIRGEVSRGPRSRWRNCCHSWNCCATRTAMRTSAIPTGRCRCPVRRIFWCPLFIARPPARASSCKSRSTGLRRITRAWAYWRWRWPARLARETGARGCSRARRRSAF